MSLKGLLGRDRITISLLVCLFQWTSVFCIGHQQMSKWRKVVTEWGGALFRKLTGGGYGVSRSALKHFNCRTKFLPNWSKCNIYTTQWWYFSYIFWVTAMFNSSSRPCISVLDKSLPRQNSAQPLMEAEAKADEQPRCKLWWKRRPQRLLLLCVHVPHNGCGVNNFVLNRK